MKSYILINNFLEHLTTGSKRNNTDSFSKPLQAIPQSKKNKDWWIQNALYWKNNLSNPMVSEKDYIELSKIVSGKINKSSYAKVLNKYGLKSNRSVDTELKNFDFVSPLMMKLLTEIKKRGFDPIVVANSSEYVNKQQELKKEMTLKMVQQIFIKTLTDMGKYQEGQTDEQGNPVEEPIHPDVIEKQARTLKDTISEEAQALLNYAMNDIKLKDILGVLAFDFISYNVAATFKGVRNKQLVYNRVRGCDIYYSGSGVEKYIEDCEAVKCVSYYTLSGLVTLFAEFEEFTNDLIEKLESDEIGSDKSTNYKERSFSTLTESSHNDNLVDSNNRYSDEDVLGNSVGGVMGNNNNDNDIYKVEHIQWTGKEKAYRIERKDYFGDTDIQYFTEEYTPEEGEEFELRWINTEYELYIINNDIIIGNKKSDYQRADFDNPNLSKKYYNARIFMSEFPETETIGRKLESRQELYNILKWNYNRLINKMKGAMTALPLSLIASGIKDTGITQSEVSSGVEIDRASNHKDSDISVALHYADETGYLFLNDAIDYTQAQIAATLMKTLNANVGQDLQILANHMVSVKEEAEELVGFNRFRQSNITTEDAVGNVQQGLSQSQLVTEEMFSQFFGFMLEEVRGIADLTQYAYDDTLVAPYLMSDSQIARRAIDKNKINYNSLAIFINTDGKSVENLNQFKALAQAFAQNGSKPSVVGRILNSNGNIETIIAKVEEMERDMEEQQSQQMQAQQQTQLKIEEYDYKKHSEELNKEFYKINTEAQLKMAELRAKAQMDDNTSGNSQGKEHIKMLIEAEKLLQKENERITDALFKKADLQIKQEELATKRYISDKTLAVARENK
jgi:hypothetical protein